MILYDLIKFDHTMMNTPTSFLDAISYTKERKILLHLEYSSKVSLANAMNGLLNLKKGSLDVVSNEPSLV
jgi:hypothetical protein